MKKIRQKIKYLSFMACYGLPASAFASTSGSGLPWESTLETISDSISGPVLLAASTVMFIVTLLMAAFGDWSDGFQKVLKISVFLSACFGVTSFISICFGGGVVV
jgi:type IV secretion system protein VirB2